jgi:hypothetical protein
MKLKEGIVAVVVVDWWWCLLVFLRIDPVNYLFEVNREVEGMEVVCKE